MSERFHTEEVRYYQSYRSVYKVNPVSGCTLVEHIMVERWEVHCGVRTTYHNSEEAARKECEERQAFRDKFKIPILVGKRTGK